MSNAAGAVSSVLMSLPLIAVPCLAVFGLPTIGPATAEADVEDPVELVDGDDLGPASTAPVAAAEAAFSPIVDAEAVSSPTAPVADRSGIDPTSDHRGAAANRAVNLDDGVPPIGGAATAVPPANVFAVEDTPRAPARPAASSAEPGDSWEQAVAKLSTLGIRDFQLTNGDLPGEFHFACSLRESDGVTRRFEAEGKTSAAAADDVSRQVEQWLATR